MRARRLLLVWAALLALLAGQIGLTRAPAGGFGQALVLLLAVAMAGVIAFGFMHLGGTRPLGRGFALAAMVWLAILLGLGSVDRLTRRDVAAEPVTRFP